MLLSSKKQRLLPALVLQGEIANYHHAAPELELDAHLNCLD